MFDSNSMLTQLVVNEKIISKNGGNKVDATLNLMFDGKLALFGGNNESPFPLSLIMVQK